ncbi:MAG: hypothetical protein HW380_2230 [Magnetococcales bacterium]|nr:hypothetical protein [Magnetococcales bacterium]
MNKYSLMLVGYVLGAISILLIDMSDGYWFEQKNSNTTTNISHGIVDKPVEKFEDAALEEISDQEELQTVNKQEDNKHSRTDRVGKISSETKTKLADGVPVASVLENAQKIIEHAGEDELKVFIRNFTNYTESDISKIGDIRAFAKKMLNVASNGIVGEKAEAKSGSFETSVNFYSDDKKNIKQSFKSGDMIYAAIDTGQYNSDEIFVKWYKTDNPEIYLFRKYKIDPEKKDNFVWYQKKDGWPSGQYAVEFYSTTYPELEKIGGGSYEVW